MWIRCVYLFVTDGWTLPDSIPLFLHGTNSGPNEWNYGAQSLWHNRSSTEFPHLPSLSDLSTNQTVGLLISTSGDLHLYLDGHHSQCIATGLPANTPLYGVVDVYGNCTKIKSDILSGELDGVDIHVYLMCINSNGLIGTVGCASIIIITGETYTCKCNWIYSSIVTVYKKGVYWCCGSVFDV